MSDERTHEKGRRTGVSPHEAFRDVVRSLLQTATKKGFDPLCAEFWMGHRVDPYNYNKFSELEPEYVLENAKIAAEYLNILSGTTPAENRYEVDDLRNKVTQLEFAVKLLQEASRYRVEAPGQRSST